MKLRKLTDRSQVEKREFAVRPGVSEMGRSTVFFTCPFCGQKIEAYIWSLCGGGKRCTNTSCRAFCSYGVAWRDMVPVSYSFGGLRHG